MYKYIVITIITIIIFYFYPLGVINMLPYKLKKISYYHGIPLVVYRTQKTRYTNQKHYTSCHQAWLDINPKFQIIWYTDKQCDLFMKNFNVRIYNAYKKIKTGAFKADLWRLCILYKNGGIYADNQMTIYKPIENLLKYIIPDNTHHFISVLDCKQSGGGIHNGFMIASIKHPFLKQCINDIVNNIENCNYTDNVFGVTGPICLYRSIQKVLLTPVEFKIGYNYIKDITFYLLKFNWGLFQYISDNDIIIGSKKYDTLLYIYDKLFNKYNYRYMWDNKLIY